jgi:hypothetical protein
MKKYVIGGIIAIVALVIVIFVLGSLFMIASTGGHTQPLRGGDSDTNPFVTNEPVDQKKNMGLYDDAKGPPWSGMPIVGATRMPWGTCYKPGVAVSFDKYGNGIYAKDDEVIWRCLQTRPTGEPVDAPTVYCHIQREQNRPPAVAWRCYHDYSIVFDFYEYDYGKSPLILPDEIEFIDTTEMK